MRCSSPPVSRCSRFPGPAVLYIVSRSIDQGRTAGLAVGARRHDGDARPHRRRGDRALVARARVDGRVRRRALRRRRVPRLPRRAPAADAPRRTRSSRNARRGRLRRLYTQGVVVNLLNPKTIVFIFAFIPQFVDVNAGHVWLQIVLLGLTLAGARAPQRQPLRDRRRLDRRPAARIARGRALRALVRRRHPRRSRRRRGGGLAKPVDLSCDPSGDHAKVRRRMSAGDGGHRGNGASRLLRKPWGPFLSNRDADARPLTTLTRMQIRELQPADWPDVAADLRGGHPHRQRHLRDGRPRRGRHGTPAISPSIVSSSRSTARSSAGPRSRRLGPRLLPRRRGAQHLRRRARPRARLRPAVARRAHRVDARPAASGRSSRRLSRERGEPRAAHWLSAFVSSACASGSAA